MIKSMVKMEIIYDPCMVQDVGMKTLLMFCLKSSEHRSRLLNFFV